MTLTETQIKEINKECPYGQGIFLNPHKLDNMGLCIYSRYIVGSMPGSCWDDENTINEYQSHSIGKDHFKVLDLTIKEICPNITYMQYKEIDSLIQIKPYTEGGYYGDYDEYEIKYIVLSDLLTLIESFN